ncbi:MAG: hypothetical protein Q7T07_02175 [Burkholderiaceae bacterium]|nr:hypothetical protein [Burkholderiaceae bacterium]
MQGIHEVADGLGGITQTNIEQSTALSEIAQAVKELDNITQHNGAMVDQALQATVGLRDRASNLSEAVTAVVDEKTSYILPLSEDSLIGCGVFKSKGGFSLTSAGVT